MCVCVYAHPNLCACDSHFIMCWTHTQFPVQSQFLVVATHSLFIRFTLCLHQKLGGGISTPSTPFRLICTNNPEISASLDLYHNE